MTEWLVTIVGTLIASLLLLEAKAWYPKLLQRILRSAAQRVPVAARAEKLEEWSAWVADHPSASAKLWSAISFWWIAPRCVPDHPALIAAKEFDRARHVALRHFRLSKKIVLFGKRFTVVLATSNAFWSLFNWTMRKSCRHLENINQKGERLLFVCLQTGDERLIAAARKYHNSAAHMKYVERLNKFNDELRRLDASAR